MKSLAYQFALELPKGAIPTKSFAYVLAFLILGLIALYAIADNKRTPKSNLESFLGAPNRKTPLSDEELEGPRLDRFLGWALLGTLSLALALPLYFLAEPGRQVGAINGFVERSVHRGEESFGAVGHAVFNCASCHGPTGGGGVAPWTISQFNADGTQKIDPDTKKQLIKSVSWAAPRINNIGLRYRKDQIRNIIIYGRGTNKPMPAWGGAGGGPANDQQINDLVNFLRHSSIKGDPVALKAYQSEWKISHDADKSYDKAMEAAAPVAQDATSLALSDLKKAASKAVAEEQKATADAQAVLDAAILSNDPGKVAVAQRKFDAVVKNIVDAKASLASTDGKLLFDMNCARCHTNGYSYGEPKQSAGGFYGPKLSGPSLSNQFPDREQQKEFIAVGVDDAKAFGTGGVNSWSGGGMPHFGTILSPSQLNQIVNYERSL